MMFGSKTCKASVATVGAVVGMAALLGGPLLAVGQGTDPSFTGISRPDDLIIARQALMQINETAMMPIDRASNGEDVPLDVLQQQAFTISTVLSVAPHLFPSTTKPVFLPDGSPPATAATEAIWKDFDAFYDQMMDASNIAYDASQAPDIGKFREMGKKLRAACDSCHEVAMKVFDPTKP
jgi:cytochrome c556